MRGSPPVQLALLLLGFFAVGVPLVQLTHGRSEPPAQVQNAMPTAVENRPVFVRVRYAHKPLKLVLKKGGEDLLINPDLAVSPVESHARFAVPVEGLELSLRAEWPPGTPETALTVEVEPDGMEGRSQTCWSIGGRIEDTVTFTWK